VDPNPQYKELTMNWKPLGWGLLAGTLALGACDSSTALGPENQLEVTNQADNFAVQATALDGVSESLTYTWAMSGPVADVNQSGVVSGGAGTLTILDDDGTEVYSRSLAQTGTFQTAAGVPGAWTIRVILNGMSGVLNVRVQKP
jgi:hypothetical protein